MTIIKGKFSSTHLLLANIRKKLPLLYSSTLL